MRRYLFSIIILIALLAAKTMAQPVKESDARTVANNWIKVVITKKGSWGNSDQASVASISEFKRKGRTLGYFCKVEPVGYIIVSVRKELSPVKVYSDTSNLDPESEKGFADLIKYKIEKTILAIEKKAGPIHTAKTEDVKKMLEIDSSSAWDELMFTKNGIPAEASEVQDQIVLMNYSGGEPWLLSSSWHQDDPYNGYCPDASGGCTSARCLVGCVATAGAQIMRYWAWPPKDTSQFDWANMPDRLTSSSSSTEINEVSWLCSHVGIQVGMNYCSDDCESGSQTYDMQGVYVNNYRYSSSCNRKDRTDYSAVDWFELMKAQFNQNRPIHYRILSHSIVADGWEEVGSVPTRRYHMNYGWDNSYTTWYTLDGLHNPDPDGSISDEYIVTDIYPGCAVYDTMSGDYMKTTLGYRYFDQDATGDSATFWAGQKLQFLPGVVVKCSNSTGGYLRFIGVNSDPSWNMNLFSNGDLSRGIKMIDSEIRVYNGGGIQLY
jgi:hypothetical protein